jgi:hypothetical protein
MVATMIFGGWSYCLAKLTNFIISLPLSLMRTANIFFWWCNLNHYKRMGGKVNEIEGQLIFFLQLFYYCNIFKNVNNMSPRVFVIWMNATNTSLIKLNYFVNFEFECILWCCSYILLDFNNISIHISKIACAQYFGLNVQS